MNAVEVRARERWRVGRPEQASPEHGLVLHPPVDDPLLPLFGGHLVLVNHPEGREEGREGGSE